MGTRTADETGAETAGTTTDDERADLAEAGATDEVTEEAPHSEEHDDEPAAEDGAAVADGSAGVGQGAGAVVSAVLGFVSLTGSWIGTLAGERQSVVGQLQTSASSGTTVARRLEAIYGDAWQTTALWAGFFALAALVTGVVVLARPAFGSPARPQAAWIKSVSWAGVALGVIGLLLAVLKYTDALLGLPSAG
ncbi:hypothetical protein GCM10010269_61320 [Streptomyces humidus]|uniref:Uncharacterized protein n=1 Tax=Streptomyces humidus TaxID=52259 RepID=A0A918G2U7_9ACTN|nr:hypothetical protein [Streptomyces humidus]GGS13781.1 hypothetical protein GCM10010269_61320 [Streptomyces humidus]